MGLPAGSKNAYYCETCRGYTITVHADEGVTPMFLACRASGEVGECDGTAQSMLYRDVDSAPAHVPKEPEWEWYALGPDEFAGMEGSEIAHYRSGGLKLRKIEGYNEPDPEYYDEDTGGL